MSPHDSSSIIPATASSNTSTCSSEYLSPFISQPIDLDNGPSASSPYPTPKEVPYPSKYGEDMSDFDDSEPEDDLSPILNALITIPIPQNTIEANELMHQALSKRKSALYKSKLADAASQEALLKARLCRTQARHAKHVSNAANIYIDHVRWAIKRSRHKSVLSKPTYTVTSVMNPGSYGIQLNHIVNVPGGSMAITLD